MNVYVILGLLGFVLFLLTKKLKRVFTLYDVVIIVGGIDGIGNVFDEKLFAYLQKVQYNNIVYVGTVKDASYVSEQITIVTGKQIGRAHV